MITNQDSNCPYKGLQPYTEADRKYFFGRERDNEVIASNLFIAPLTVFYGTSGVGKSSVLQAGAIPQLRRKPRVVVIYFNEWQDSTFNTALKRQIATEVCEKVKVTEQEAIERIQKHQEKADGRNAVARNNRGLSFETMTLDQLLLSCAEVFNLRILLVFDQFEEYFLYHTPTTSTQGFDAEFARVVNQADNRVNFLISMREEELSKLDRFRQRIPNLLSNLLRLDNLSRNSAITAIIRPLKVYNQEHANGARKGIEAGLVRAILDEVNPRNLSTERQQTIGAGTAEFPGAKIETPFLQLVLTRLWEEELRLGSNKLRLRTLQDLGGAKNIASTYLDEVMGKLDESERETAASILRFLVTSTGAKIAQQPSSLAAWADLGPQNVRDVLAKLSSRQDMRILRKVTVPNQEERFELFHDVLGPAIVAWRARHVQEQQIAHEREEAAIIYRVERQRVRRLRWALVAGAIMLLAMSSLTVFALKKQREAGTERSKAETQKGIAEKQTGIAEEALRTNLLLVESLTKAKLDLEGKNLALVAEKNRADEAYKKAEQANSELVAEKENVERERDRANTQASIAQKKADEAQAEALKGQALGFWKDGKNEEAKARFEFLTKQLKAKHPAIESYALASIADIEKDSIPFGLVEADAMKSLPKVDDSDSAENELLKQYCQLLKIAPMLAAMKENDEDAVFNHWMATGKNASANYHQALAVNKNSQGPDVTLRNAEILTKLGDLHFGLTFLGEQSREAKAQSKPNLRDNPQLVDELLTNFAYYDLAQKSYHQANRPEGEAEVLIKMGNASWVLASGQLAEGSSLFPGQRTRRSVGKMSDWLTAADYYDQASEAYLRAKKPLLAATSLRIIAKFYDDLPSDDPAKRKYAEYLTKARVIYYQEKEFAKAGGMDEKLAEDYINKEEYAKGLQSYLQALESYGKAAASEKSDSAKVVTEESRVLTKVATLIYTQPETYGFADGKDTTAKFFDYQIKSAGSPMQRVRTLITAGRFYKSQSEAKIAAQFLSQARDIYAGEQQFTKEAELNEQIAQLYDDPSESAEAVRAYKLALRAWARAAQVKEETPAETSKRRELTEIVAAILFNSGGKDAAIAFFEEQIAGASHVSDKARTAAVAGDFFRNKKNFADTYAYYRREREWWTSLRDYAREANTYYKIGTVFNEEKNIADAIKSFDLAAVAYRKIDQETLDRSQLAPKFLAVAAVYALVDKPKALEVYEEALRSEKLLNTVSYQLVPIFQATAQLLVEMKTPEADARLKRLIDEMRAYYRERKTGDEGTLFNSVAEYYRKAGNIDAARSYLEQERQTYVAAKNQYGLQGLLRRLAALEPGEQSESRFKDYCLSFAETSKQRKDFLTAGVALEAVANYYRDSKEVTDTNRREKSISYFEQSAEAYRQAGAKSAEATALRNASYVYGLAGNRAKAAELRKKADALTGGSN